MANAVTREEFYKMCEGLEEIDPDKAWADYCEGVRRTDILEAAGVKVSWEKHLDRLSNARWQGGRLLDAKCHYVHRVTVSGNTFSIKDDLKAAGFRWDPANKAWWRLMTTGLSIADNSTNAINEVVAMLEGE